MEQDAAPEVGAGTVVSGTYQLTRLIGRGGMGAVWEARHLRLPKRVAVKFLLGAAGSSTEAFARFRREAEIASRLGHPNIIEVIDFDSLPSGTPFLVLEFLDGESLAARLRRGPIPLDAATAIARQIGSALQAVHREQIVHRDLKPENIFLCPREVDGVITDHVKVLDFGISKIHGSTTVKTQEAAMLGTPQYMSPEQALGKNASIDARTDQFALGAIVYEMLSGAPPFEGDNLAQLVFRVVYEPHPPLASRVPSLPPRVVAAVERALQKDAAARFPDVATFIAELSGRALQTLDRRSSAALAVSETVAAGTGVSASQAGAPGPAPSSPGVGSPPGLAASRPGGAAPSSRSGGGLTPAVAYDHTLGPGAAVPAPASLGATALPAASAAYPVAGPAGAPGTLTPSLSGTSGQVVVASLPVAGPPGRGRAVVLGLGVAGLVGAAVAITLQLAGGGGSKQPTGVAAAGPAGAAAAGPTAAAPRPDDPADPAPAVSPDATDSAFVAASPPDAAPGPGSAAASPADAAPLAVKPPRPPKDDPDPPAGESPAGERDLPADVAADLKEAEALLASQQWEKASYLASRTLHRKATARANSIMAIAACARGQWQPARAAFNRLSGRPRAHVARRCAKLGMEL